MAAVTVERSRASEKSTRDRSVERHADRACRRGHGDDGRAGDAERQIDGQDLSGRLETNDRRHAVARGRVERAQRRVDAGAASCQVAPVRSRDVGDSGAVARDQDAGDGRTAGGAGHCTDDEPGRLLCAQVHELAAASDSGEQQRAERCLRDEPPRAQLTDGDDLETSLAEWVAECARDENLILGREAACGRRRQFCGAREADADHVDL